MWVAMEELFYNAGVDISFNAPVKKSLYMMRGNRFLLMWSGFSSLQPYWF
ncbi:hypothetical protein HanPSC8_Chr08g0321571 [Helianthus annuus]|nr:hypothetical protein HanPSC8_Chr08g0321571 [Helianthus annuus]